MEQTPSNDHLVNCEPHFAAENNAEQLKVRFNNILSNYLADENKIIEQLLPFTANTSEQDEKNIRVLAKTLIDELQTKAGDGASLEAFLTQYSLETAEGLQLMSLAEALVRIPDSRTAEALIQSKLKGADWVNHLGNSLSPLVNVTTRALLFSNYILNSETQSSWLHKLTKKLGEPVIREALLSGMKLFGKQFVLGENLEQALSHTAAQNKALHNQNQYTFSFDMLGEAALSAEQAEQYFKAYQQAIEHTANNQPIDYRQSPSISIKLSALHPRYEGHQAPRVLSELVPKMTELISQAKKSNVTITIDAEECERLELSLQVFEALYTSSEFSTWPYLGLAVQAYSKRAFFVLQWLKQLSLTYGKKIPVRLVKGAYWDSEIKYAQVMGLDNYPVFTHKSATDISFLACARYLIKHSDYFYPQFATHNAQSVASILCWTKAKTVAFEFQRLHGMGKALYDFILSRDQKLNCRVYAPVGAHRELLPYLIRRLLENGSSQSFINQLARPDASTDDLVAPPAQTWQTECNTRPIPLPANIYRHNRKNAAGFCTQTQQHRDNIISALHKWRHHQWHGYPLVHGVDQGHYKDSPAHAVYSPYNRRERVGTTCYADNNMVTTAYSAADQAWQTWHTQDITRRSQLLLSLADSLETHSNELLALLVREAGKTIPDALAEIREAVDFCRYYAIQGQATCKSIQLDGPTGEDNTLYYQARGIITCISPWNFPMAIFIGQITAALVTGNCVIAKPAEQTSLMAYRLVEIMHQVGFPSDVIQLLTGLGETVGENLIKHPLLAGVTFTGSFATAQLIQRRLAERPGEMLPLIAETGGQNVMLVDSSALPEQVVQDAIQSAFGSAGQRCSALRILYLQDSIADRIIQLLTGAVKELHIGSPDLIETDIGPVIDQQALERLQQHVAWLNQHATHIASAHLTKATQQLTATADAYFIPPCIYQIERLDQIKEENFGPILHVIRYEIDELPDIIKQINQSGYGLTFGIHSRNQDTVEAIQRQIRVGNIYVNRNMVGAVVGVQPFGGMGLSGTGPKAGGPHYLHRFLVEKVLTDNTAAIGGNVTLLVKH